jgi:hypothetical protein
MTNVTTFYYCHMITKDSEIEVEKFTTSQEGTSLWV